MLNCNPLRRKRQAKEKRKSHISSVFITRPLKPGDRVINWDIHARGGLSSAPLPETQITIIS